MMRFYRSALLGLAAACLFACGKQAAPVSPLVLPEAPHARLGHVVEGYWDANAALSPWYSWGGAELRYGEAPTDTLSAQALADSLAVERRYLAEVLLVARAPLDIDAKLTYDLFWRERKLAIESYTYPTELMPVNAFEGVPQRFAMMASAAALRAVSSAKEFDNWQSRAGLFARWTEQAIANLREGIRRDYRLPRVTVERALPLLAALGEDAPASVFYRSLPAVADSDRERARLTQALHAEVRDKILPAYRTLHDFLQREYLPRSRDSIGMSALPLGSAWYAYLSRRATDSALTPAELHALGVAEVDHLRARLQSLLAETAFAGNVTGFIDNMTNDPHHSYRTTEELLTATEALKTQVASGAATVLSVAPRADFDLRSDPAFLAASVPLMSYQRAMAYGKTMAVLYVDTNVEAHPATDFIARYLREAVPGHHTQAALQEERADLPRFRRFGGAPAFVAGWGLYAASLGDELGLYRDAESKFGFLQVELECAVGLVIDTGIHSQKWTRVQAMDYVHSQVPVDPATVADIVDRVIALPGAALACTTGYLKIQSLRTRAQQTLGARFELPAFNAEVLRNGAVPLDLLDADIRHWVESVVVTAPKVD